MPAPKYPALPVTQKQGSERFRTGQTELGFSVLDFWRWSTSDLLSNATRGIVAEYIVAQALGVATGARCEWSAYDLVTLDGITVEVKSAAYVQRWAQQELSAIGFSVGPTRRWDPQTNVLAHDACRQASVYVLALLANKEKATCDPLDVAQWKFYVVAACDLDARIGSRERISLDGLAKLGVDPVDFAGLARKVAAVAGTSSGQP